MSKWKLGEVGLGIGRGGDERLVRGGGGSLVVGEVVDGVVGGRDRGCGVSRLRWCWGIGGWVGLFWLGKAKSGCH